MTRFIYTGPPSGVTLRLGEHCQDILLWPNKDIDLPAEHEYTQTLVALGYLKRPAIKNGVSPKGDKK